MNEFEENFKSLEGEQTDLALTFVYEDAYTIGDSQIHISMRVILYIGCVPKLIVEADQVILQVNKPTPIRAHLWCGSTPMDNILFV